MFDIFIDVNGETVLFSVVVLCAIIALSVKTNGRCRPMAAKQLTVCSLCIALAFVTSYIRIYEMPFGGTVTLCSMLFIVLPGYWYGPGTGLCAGFVYGILQFIKEPLVLSFFQVCCDYLLAFTALGMAGIFKEKKHGLVWGYLIGALGRGSFHTLGGYLYWIDYMPENFPKEIAFAYPIIYNFSYIIVEVMITIIIINLPPVKKAFSQIKKMAAS